MFKLFLLVIILNDFHRQLIFTLCSSVNEETDEFVKTNMIFQHNYAQARQRLLKTFDPLIILDQTLMTVVHHGERQVFETTLSLYHNLKTISHVPLTVYVSTFNPQAENRTLSSEELINLKRFLQQIRVLRKKIRKSDFLSDETLFKLQHSILELSINYLRQIIRFKQTNATSMRAFCQESTKLFGRNLGFAAQAQLDTIHNKIYPWFTNVLNETERQSIQILILGPKTPRPQNLATQYFTKLLGGQTIEGKQFTYAENVDQVPLAMNIMGTWFLDQQIGDTFFDDDTRMHRDLLSTVAQNYIEKLFNSENK